MMFQLDNQDNQDINKNSSGEDKENNDISGQISNLNEIELRQNNQTEPSIISSPSVNNSFYKLNRNGYVNKCFKYFSIRNQNLALAIMCCCALMQNILVGGANNAILTTIERAYFMTSIESALFLAFYDIANIISSPFIGYFGDRIHKPFIISFSMFGLSIGSIILTLPQFISNDSSYSSANKFQYQNSTIRPESQHNAQDMLCFNMLNADSNSIKNQDDIASSFSQDSLINNMKYVFYLANIVNGISSVGLYTTAVSYLENIFDKEKVHMRQGIYYAVGAIGVGIGMMVTGNFLNINSSKLKQMIKNDVNSTNNNIIDSNNVNWIGAWWAIYMIGAFVNFFLAILVLRFSPKLVVMSKRNRSVNNFSDLSSTKSDISLNRPSETSSVSLPQISLKNKQTFGMHVKEFAKNAKLILSNRVYLFIVICTTCETLLIKGFSSYLTKMLEYEYRLPASTATMIAGAIGFISLVGGALLGSYLVKRFKWHIKQCSKFITVILFITSVLFLGLIIHCPQEKYIHSKHENFISSKCDCDSNSFYPICYENKYLFQTPCHGGCKKLEITHREYLNCTVLYSLLDQSISTPVIMKPCRRPASQCLTNLVFVSLIGLAVLFLSSIVILPLLRIILESVSIENQSFALGIRSLVTKLFGNIPGPLIFASIVDKSCVQWTLSSTHNKTCRLYDNAKFSLGLGLLGSGFRFLSATFALITLFFIRKQDSLEIQSSTYETITATSSTTDIDKAKSTDNNAGFVNRAFADEKDSLK